MGLLVALLMLFGSASATAQDRLSISLRGGGAVATQNLSDADLGVGLGLEGTLAYQFVPYASVYGGWGWRRFPTDGASFAGVDVDVEETGYSLGLQYARPLGVGGLDYFVRAGGIYAHLEIEDGGGSVDSEHGLGWQVGTGLIVSLGESWRLMPGVRYRSLYRDIEVDGTTTDVDLRYVALGVALAWTM
jgi:hypothetical protein